VPKKSWFSGTPFTICWQCPAFPGYKEAAHILGKCGCGLKKLWLVGFRYVFSKNYG
jgi:hypothetical protein